MNAKDVMTTEVITVAPDTAVQALAALLSEKGISGAPVVDAAGRLVGIVSEGDLLHRAEVGTERRVQRRRSWWLDSVAEAGGCPRLRQGAWPRGQGHHDARCRLRR